MNFALFKKKNISQFVNTHAPFKKKNNSSWLQDYSNEKSTSFHCLKKNAWKRNRNCYNVINSSHTDELLLSLQGMLVWEREKECRWIFWYNYVAQYISRRVFKQKKNIENLKENTIEIHYFCCFIWYCWWFLRIKEYLVVNVILGVTQKKGSLWLQFATAFSGTLN